MASEIKWIKITTNIFDDEKIKIIEAMPDADAILVIWFKLLTQAGKVNKSGALFLTDKLAYTDEMLATIFNRKVSTVRLALETFEQLKMIERGDYIQISNWEKHQNLEGMEKIRIQDNERQQRFYYKNKLRVLGYKNEELPDDVELLKTMYEKPNVSLTLSHGIDKEEDKEEELDIEKYKEEKNTKKKTATKRQPNGNPIDVEPELVYFTDLDLNETFIAFLEMRKKLKAINSDLAIKKLLNILDPFNDNDKLLMINNSIVNSWKGLFPIKHGNSKQSQKEQVMNDIDAALRQMKGR